MISHIIKLFIIIFIFEINLLAQGEEEFKGNNSQGDTAEFVMVKSPWGAVLRSAVVPGWGQIYNESYWKAPVFWAIGAWLIYNWIQNDQDYKFYRNLYSRTSDEDYRDVRLSYRDQRDLFSIYLGLTYILNLVDAYVDAHLFDFTVEESFYTGSPMLGIKLKF